MEILSEYWPYATSCLCGLCLIAFLLALIFDSNFRKDLIAGRGKVSFLKLFSAEGVVPIVLMALLVAGLSCPLFLSSEREINRDNLPSIVKSLDPSDTISEEIREIAKRRKGPWSPYRKSKNLLVSVPGGLKDNQVRGCPELYKKTVQLLSNHKIDGEPTAGLNPIKVTVNGLIFDCVDCREKLGYDLQLNCKLAHELFSARVLECDENNNPLWHVEDRYLSCSGVVMINE